MSPVVASDTAGQTFPWTDLTPADFQADVTVTGKNITGKLTFIDGGLSPSGPLAGDGYFLALKLSGIDAAATSVKVGLTPSAGTGLVELIDDPDKDVVMKISNKATQKFTVVTSYATTETVDYYDLSGLTLLAPADAEGV